MPLLFCDGAGRQWRTHLPVEQLSCGLAKIADGLGISSVPSREHVLTSPRSEPIWQRATRGQPTFKTNLIVVHFTFGLPGDQKWW